MEKKTEEIIDAQIVEVPKAQPGGMKKFEFNLPEKFGSLPAPMSIKQLQQQDRHCKKLFGYMEQQNKKHDGTPLDFKEGALFGKVPGIPRPMCFEPGLELIMRYFQLKRGPTYKEEIPLDNIVMDNGKVITGHIKVKAWTVVLNGETGLPVYVLEGSASTKETKHRFRGGGVKCPACGEKIRESVKNKTTNHYYCWKEKGGCGANYDKGDKTIEDQPTGMWENENPIDQQPTVEEMAVIRALRKIIKFTGMSRYFIENPEVVGNNFSDEVEESKGETYQKAEPKKKQSNGNGVQLATAEQCAEIKSLILGHYGDNMDDALAWLDQHTKTANIPGLKNFDKMAKIQYDWLIKKYEEMTGA
jgi:hypothetical protein